MTPEFLSAGYDIKIYLHCLVNIPNRSRDSLPNLLQLCVSPVYLHSAPPTLAPFYSFYFQDLSLLFCPLGTLFQPSGMAGCSQVTFLTSLACELYFPMVISHRPVDMC